MKTQKKKEKDLKYDWTCPSVVSRTRCEIWANKWSSFIESTWQQINRHDTQSHYEEHQTGPEELDRGIVSHVNTQA